ncbi:hypothetical protein N7507_008423 [Penicillium longicatenatum]|nr:hypothetical protein N7507_008423 [Penicillium longicatenatum]
MACRRHALRARMDGMHAQLDSGMDIELNSNGQTPSVIQFSHYLQPVVATHSPVVRMQIPNTKYEYRSWGSSPGQ